MKRFLTTIVVPAVLAALVGAQSPGGPSLADQARLLQRNRSLYQAAVHNGLSHSTAFDPLDRARYSTELAQQFADEMQKAAEAKEPARVAELGGHLGKVVDQGVVANLSQARQNIKAGSLAEKALFQRRDEALDLLRPLEEKVRTSLGSEGARDLEPVLKTIREGQSKVEKAAEAPEK